MARIIVFAVLFFVSSCFRINGLLADTVTLPDGLAVLGKYYARISYYEELKIEIMCFGLQEQFVSAGEGWVTVVFRRYINDRPLKHRYLFDTAKLTMDIGELNIKSSSPLDYTGEPYNITEFLNRSSNTALFITYHFIASESYMPPVEQKEPVNDKVDGWSYEYKRPIPFGQLRFEGLTLDGEAVQGVNLNISNWELPARIHLQ